MSARVLFSIIELPTHPNFSVLYQRLGFEELRLNSQRKAINELKSTKPEFVVAEFVCSYSTYYQATNMSNLDVFLHSLVKYSPETKVIVLAKKEDRERVEKLTELFPLHGILISPVQESHMEQLLSE